jgi:nucleoside-diphosphate-sugar epimerase
MDDTGRSDSGQGGILKDASIITRNLITGGAGFIGSHLAEALIAQGQQVVAVDNLSTGRIENLASLMGHSSFQFVYETIHNEMVMDRLVSDCDVIYHLAAAVGVELIIRDPVHTIETNLIGTELVLRLARRYRKKVLIASSSEVYGKSDAIPYREDADRVMGPTIKSRWSYAESKAMDEFLALAYHKQFGVPAVICRFFNTVGPRQTGMYGMVIPRLVQQALAGEPLTVYGDGQQTRCFCNVQDTVRAMVGLAAEPRAVGEIFNVGSVEEVTILELARRVLARTGSPSEIRLIPYDQAYEAGFEDMRRRVPDTGKIRAWIGWQPTVSLDQTLDQVIAEFRSAPAG